jgi:ankyrin repeat protein
MSNHNLISLCRNGDVDAVRQMIADKCDVNVEVDGVSPISVAIKNNDRSLASILLDAGATLPQPSPTPLHLAVASGSADVAEMLISRGMKVTVEDIITAACIDNRSLVVLLLSKFKSDGSSILHLLSRIPEPEKHLAAINLIVELSSPSIDINVPDWTNLTPLQFAALTRNAHVASALIKAGADVNANGGPGGYTPLIMAGYSGCMQVAKVLLDVGPAVQLNARDALGNTALHAAAMLPSMPVTMALLEARADVNAMNHKQRTPLWTAANNDIAYMLVEAGAEVNQWVDFSNEYS